MPNKKVSLDPDDILSAEFEYIANSAFQANEDRSKAASFFLVSVGALVATIFGAGQDVLSAQTYLVLAGLFFVLTLLGGLTISQLARLRAAWHEAARAMNQIKDYYNAELKGNDLHKAFRWRTETLPMPYKRDSISFTTALEVALLSGLTFGTSAYFLQLSLGSTNPVWWITLGAGGVAFFLELFFYKSILTKARQA